MNEDELLDRFGLHPSGRDLAEIRRTLTDHTAWERRQQGAGDTTVMKLCCVQLFNNGDLADALLIWEAKQASFDSHCSIDLEFMCGAGLAETKVYLSSLATVEGEKALGSLIEYEEAGVFDDFIVAGFAEAWESYYYPQV